MNGINSGLRFVVTLNIQRVFELLTLCFRFTQSRDNVENFRSIISHLTLAWNILENGL